jgi:beta-glucosidase/6-phospho-beta-glucosidase/beta-galactosidase
MQTALLCAFADPSSSDEHDKIRALKSQDDIMHFCDEHMPVYFIVDQMNALDHEDVNMDTVDNQRKTVAQESLDKLTSSHYQITSASANHRTAMHMKKMQTGEMKLALMGGMSEVSKCSSYSFLVSFSSSTRDAV